jgi:hypothetical protein
VGGFVEAPAPKTVANLRRTLRRQSESVEKRAEQVILLADQRKTRMVSTFGKRQASALTAECLIGHPSQSMQLARMYRI